MLVDRDPYSYRDDARVPAFDDRKPIVFMDGTCALCTAGARTIARFDRNCVFLICPVQTSTGRAVLEHYGLDADDPDSWLALIDGQAFTSLDAIIRVANRIGGAGRALGVLRVLPRPMQDWLYRRIARNRYRVFGRADMCAVPDPALRARLME